MLRREMTGMAKDCGMDSEGIADVRLAVTEAATNAVIHAYAKAEGELSVTATMQDGELAIVIGDTGPGLVERRDSPGLGVGLSVIASVAERLKIVSHPGGTEIHMAFPCPNAD
jgi:anti-sigma regulatory factor (Ser/Thr protein kinase)